LASCLKGKVYLYGNIDGNIYGSFALIDSVISRAAGSRYSAYNLTVSGGDLNNDSLTDMLLGFYGGGIQVWYQDTSTVSVPEISGKEIIYVYPNPVTDLLIIKTSFRSKNTHCRIFDLTGRLIYSHYIKDNYTFIDLSAVSPGAYLLNVISEKFSVTEKVMVER
jgi:hypothetical protein